MWYRKAKTPLDWTCDWEPTIYFDTLTLQPTTRTRMLEIATDDMFEALDMGMEQARIKAYEEAEGGNAFEEMEKGMELMQHDFEEALQGEGSSASDKMHRHRKPKMEGDMRHVTQHGRHFLRLESNTKREKRKPNDFSGIAPRPVDTYIGTLWKAKNPLIPEGALMRFG